MVFRETIPSRELRGVVNLCLACKASRCTFRERHRSRGRQDGRSGSLPPAATWSAWISLTADGDMLLDTQYYNVAIRRHTTTPMTWAAAQHRHGALPSPTFCKRHDAAGGSGQARRQIADRGRPLGPTATSSITTPTNTGPPSVSKLKDVKISPPKMPSSPGPAVRRAVIVKTEANPDDLRARLESAARLSDCSLCSEKFPRLPCTNCAPRIALVTPGPTPRTRAGSGWLSTACKSPTITFRTKS